MNTNKKYRIHVANPAAACGYVGHMTAQELKELSLGSHFSASCPICGQVHLNRDEIREIETYRVTRSDEYQQLVREAFEGQQ